MSRVLSLLLILAVACLMILRIVSAAEVPEKPGPETARENQQAPPPMRGPGRGFGPPPFPLLLALDADNDGDISAAEIENAPAALKTLDKDNDGKLSAEELRPQFDFPGGGRGPDGPPDFSPPGGPGGRGPGRDFRFPRLPLMAALDADEDEEISAAEIENAIPALKKLDENTDGKLSREELFPRFGGPGGFGPPGGPGGFGPPGSPGSQGAKLVPKFD